MSERTGVGTIQGRELLKEIQYILRLGGEHKLMYICEVYHVHVVHCSYMGTGDLCDNKKETG